MSETEKQIAAARALLRGRFHATLATASARYGGHPFGSLVPFCLDSSERPLLLLSHLSEHTRNLDTDPRCAYTLVEPETGGDIQRLGRLTGMARAERLQGEAETAAAERYFRYYPASRTYYEELGFRLYRLENERFYFVGGFGAARWFGTDRILRPVAFSPNDEEALLVALNGDRPLRRRLALASGIELEEVSFAGVDREGVDIRAGDHLLRLATELPNPDPAAVAAAVEKALPA